MSRIISLACASAILLALAAPAAAQNYPEQRIVRTSDVDAYSPRGADTVLNRIENAAEDVCGDRPGPMPLPQRQDIRACTYETMEIAVADSGNPVLHQRYHGYEPQIIIEYDYYDPSLSPKGSR